MSWLRRKLVDPLLGLLTAGLSPRRLAWSVAAGLGLGVFPVPGTTTLLCAGAGLAFRLNQPAMQLVNYLVYPLQLALCVPFIRLGDRLFGAEPLRLSASELTAGFRSGWLGQLQDFGGHFARGCAGWALTMLPIMALLGWGLAPVFTRLQARAPRRPV